MKTKKSYWQKESDKAMKEGRIVDAIHHAATNEICQKIENDILKCCKKSNQNEKQKRKRITND
jgi:hypothetical protein